MDYKVNKKPLDNHDENHKHESTLERKAHPLEQKWFDHRFIALMQPNTAHINLIVKSPMLRLQSLQVTVSVRKKIFE